MNNVGKAHQFFGEQRPKLLLELNEVTTHSSKTRWTSQQIRAARMAPLAPLLQMRGLQLLDREAVNLSLPA